MPCFIGPRNTALFIRWLAKSARAKASERLGVGGAQRYTISRSIHSDTSRSCDEQATGRKHRGRDLPGDGLVGRGRCDLRQDRGARGRKRAELDHGVPASARCVVSGSQLGWHHNRDLGCSRHLCAGSGCRPPHWQWGSRCQFSAHDRCCHARRLRRDRRSRHVRSVQPELWGQYVHP
jgi:hypothetical protein